MSSGNHIEGCNFTGVKVDADLTKAVEAIAEATKHNALVLRRLAEGLDFSGVTVESCLKFEMEKDNDY